MNQRPISILCVVLIIACGGVSGQPSVPNQVTKFFQDLQTDVTGLVARVPNPIRILNIPVFRTIIQPFYGLVGNVVETVEDTERARNSFSVGRLDKVRFLLYSDRKSLSNESYTQLNPEDDESIKNATFTATRPIKILVHGFQASGFHKFPQRLKNEYLQNTNDNVIVVDWGLLAYPPLGLTRWVTTFPSAINNMGFVARRVADMIQTLQKNSVAASPSDIHIVGLGLGSHIAGQASNLIEQRLRAKVGRVTAIEPAMTGLESAGKEVVVDKSDATFVDAIHTSYLGFYEPLGHADFYVNGGVTQPQCYDGVNAVQNPIQGYLDVRNQCSHEYGFEAFATSIKNRTLTACRCGSWADFRQSCGTTCRNSTIFGDATPSGIQGRYYLEMTLPDEILRPSGPIQFF